MDHVVVADVRMPFWSMVWFMVKWALASIPAVVVLALLYVVSGGMIAASVDDRSAGFTELGPGGG